MYANISTILIQNLPSSAGYQEDLNVNRYTFIYHALQMYKIWKVINISGLIVLQKLSKKNPTNNINSYSENIGVTPNTEMKALREC